MWPASSFGNLGDALEELSDCDDDDDLNRYTSAGSWLPAATRPASAAAAIPVSSLMFGTGV